MPAKRCANCGKKIRHVIIDWQQGFAWCAACWLEYLKDYRSAHPDPPPKKVA
jgi:hypothetical protein